jgi:hypothetical protein
VTITNVHHDVLAGQRGEVRQRVAGDGDATHPWTHIDHTRDRQQMRTRGRELGHTPDLARAGQLTEI